MQSFALNVAKINPSDLTPKEKKLIEYINVHFVKISEENMRIEKLAQEAKTGYSAIYALINQAGVSGYKELLSTIKFDAEQLKKSGSQTFDVTVKDKYIEIINQGFVSINENSLEKTVELISESKNINIIYWDNELSAPSRQLWRTLYKVGFRPILSDKEESIIKDVLEQTTAGDVFILYSTLSYKSERFKNFVQEIKSKGGNIIFIGIKEPAKGIKEFIDVKHVIVTSNNKENDLVQISDVGIYTFFNDMIISNLLNIYTKNKG
ncbi:hypothetical protein [Spiroplasma endosymbiont of Othius punctulatus]|uniref:MurR/RpiR family transcriptional regulator n=1 Tax=Spiroplasma endosymbiont of Othius punctulatus TaxID=3066289 RepID=UPI0030CA7DC1